MLGEHESSDELRGHIKKYEAESYTAEGRIKVNSPRLLLSERGHLGPSKTMGVSEFGKGVAGRKGNTLYLNPGEGGYTVVAFGISRTLCLSWSVTLCHPFRKAEMTLPSHPEGWVDPDPRTCLLGF